MKTVKELTESIQETYEREDQFRIGAADAVQHVGMVVGNEQNAKKIQVLQDEIFDADSIDYNDQYARGYRAAWDAVDNLTHTYTSSDYLEDTDTEG